MGAINEIFGYLVQTFLSLYLIAMVLRFLLQLVRADFYNPICQFLVKVTNPLVIPLRRVVPSFAGLDMASLLLAILLQMACMASLIFFKYNAIPTPGLLVMGGLLGVVGLVVNIYFFAILAMIILSFVAAGSRHPAIYLLYQITEPVMAPFRKVIPPMGGLDFSPILVFILYQIIDIALQHMAAAAHVLGLAPWLT